MSEIGIVPVGRNRWHVTADGEYAASLRWNGQHQVLSAPDGRPLGTLFRSDGVIRDGGISYTWRAYLRGPCAHCEREVARGATHEDAVAAVLDADVDAADRLRAAVKSSGSRLGKPASVLFTASWAERDRPGGNATGAWLPKPWEEARAALAAEVERNLARWSQHPDTRPGEYERALKEIRTAAEPKHGLTWTLTSHVLSLTRESG